MMMGALSAAGLAGVPPAVVDTTRLNPLLFCSDGAGFTTTE
jgi:hypothetical protein